MVDGSNLGGGGTPKNPGAGVQWWWLKSTFPRNAGRGWVGINQLIKGDPPPPLATYEAAEEGGERQTDAMLLVGCSFQVFCHTSYNNEPCAKPRRL
jgi:hypothetical protein